MALATISVLRSLGILALTVIAASAAEFTTLAVRAGATAGTLPYAATVLPLRGQVPGGMAIGSPDDDNLRSSVLSAWDDGSAAVVVVAGQLTVVANESRTLRLQATASPAGAALTAARVTALVSSVAVDFGALGTASLTNFASPERVWWANPQVICARYRVGVSGHPTLEAVVDIHAFASSPRALVEVVVENSKFAAATATAASLPGNASYTATVTVNGTQVTSVSSSGSPEGTHSGLRAWYASRWIGGDPGLRVTQLHTDLQQHPLFWKMARDCSANLSGYAGDTYTPWGAGRHRGTNMGGTGDAASIGPLTLWDAQFLQSGDPSAAHASEANALAILGYNVNYRDSTTGLVPDAEQLKGKSQTGYFRNWPRTLNAEDRMMWEVAHHPAAGLMAFICRPSPVYIEIAQKICVWNATWGADSSGLSGWPGTWPDTDYTGLFSSGYQIRGRAWSVRSLNHALFLTPDGMPWKAGGRYWLERVRLYLSGWQNHPQAILNVMWDDAPNAPGDHQGSQPGFQSPVWEFQWLLCELHRSASMRFLAGAAQTALDSLADWCALQPVRWVNEQPNGAWRYLPYTTTIGGNTPINSLPTWGEQIAAYRVGSPPTVTGEWMTSYAQAEPSVWTNYQPDTVAAGYTMQFYASLVSAVERQVPGYREAWSTVGNGITTPNWQDRFGADPRWGSAPRVLPDASGFGSGAATGSFANGIWTPGRDAAGVVNAASWASTPVNEWFAVADTSMATMDAAIQAAVPGWRDWGGGWSLMTDAWVGMTPDLDRARFWIAVGGGHGASSNNGIYEFNCFTMTWSVEHMPSNINSLDETYRRSASNGGSYTYYPPAGALAAEQVAAGTWQPINGMFYDELPDGKPTSRHTYSSTVYVPESNELVMICRRLWRYSLTTHQWTYKRAINDYPPTVTSYIDGEDGITFYDRTTGEVLTSSAGSSGIYRAIGYNLAGNSWTPWGSPWNLYAQAKEVVHGNGSKITVMFPPTRQRAQSYAPGYYWLYDIPSRTLLASSGQGGFAFGGGLTRDDFVNDNWYWESSSISYIEPLNRYWVWTAMVDGSVRLFEVDPTTTPWTISPKTTTGNLPPLGLNYSSTSGNPTQYPQRKSFYVPRLNAVVLQAAGGRDMYIYRFGNPTDPDIAVARATQALASGSTDAVAGSAVGVPSVLTYNLANNGLNPLHITAASVQALSNCTVALTTSPVGTVAASGSASAVVTVTPAAGATTGGWSADLTMISDDPDEGSYVIHLVNAGLGPEVVVSRNATVLGTTDTVAGTSVATATTLAYVIRNAGLSALTVGAPAIGTPSNCTAVITGVPATAVASGTTTSLQIVVTPTTAGAWSFPVTFTTNDADEGTVAITVSGSAVAPAPEVTVLRGATVLAAGDAVAGTLAGSGTTLTYTIRNDGPAGLTVSGTAVGAQTNCVATIVATPSGLVPTGLSTSLQIRVTPTATGAWSFPFTFASNDADEATVTITVSGTAANGGGSGGSSGGGGGSGCGAGTALGLFLLAFAVAGLRRRR